jgi:hypothetical protein
MEHDNHFKIVELQHCSQLTLSGSCALCNEQYQYGNRVLAEYYDGKHLITEPFNLCDRCYQVQKEQQTTQSNLEQWHI